MKAIQKDKQIAAYAMIAAPIDETNVQSDIIRRVFDNEECINKKRHISRVCGGYGGQGNYLLQQRILYTHQ